MMVIENTISSSLYIVEAQQYIYFTYDSQPRTCNRCGSLIHIAKDCDVYATTKPEDRENVVKLENLILYPILPRQPSSLSMVSVLDDEEMSRSTLSIDSEQGYGQDQREDESDVADPTTGQTDTHSECNITCKKCNY